MPDRQLTRANTVPGSPERQQVYAREYAARAARAGQEGVTYGQIRQLKHLWPLSQPAQASLKARHRNVSSAHTRYAIIRAQISQAEVNAGNRVSARQRRSARILHEPTGLQNPLQSLAQWYRQAGMSTGDLPAAPTQRTGSRSGGDDGGTGYNGPEREYAQEYFSEGGTFTGAGLEGYEWEEQPEYEDMYDVYWDDLDEWDLWEFVAY